MKQITMYEADDGTKFGSEAAAINHDALCATIDRAKAKLHKPPKTGSNEFVQHETEIFLEYQRTIVELFIIAVPYLKEDVHVQWALTIDQPAGMIGRIVEDSAPGPIRSAWYRVLCTDKRFREWGQPYYAIQSDYHERN